MAAKMKWRFLPGEKRNLGVSLASELSSDASLAGQTPTVTPYTYDSKREDYDEATGFTIASVSANTAAMEVVSERGGQVLETVAVGDGISFTLTAPTTRGTYYIRSECVADDGTDVGRWDELIVEGPDVPS